MADIICIKFWSKDQKQNRFTERSPMTIKILLGLSTSKKSLNLSASMKTRIATWFHHPNVLGTWEKWGNFSLLWYFSCNSLFFVRRQFLNTLIFCELVSNIFDLIKNFLELLLWPDPVDPQFFVVWSQFGGLALNGATQTGTSFAIEFLDNSGQAVEFFDAGAVGRLTFNILQPGQSFFEINIILLMLCKKFVGKFLLIILDYLFFFALEHHLHMLEILFYLPQHFGNLFGKILLILVGLP